MLVFGFVISVGFSLVQAKWSPPSVDVVDFGAVGDGVTDATGAFRSAFAAIEARGGGVVVIPPGIFFINDSLVVTTNSTPISISGAPGAALLWNCEEDFLRWEGNDPISGVQVENFAIISTGAPKGRNSTAIQFIPGVVKSVLRDVMFIGNGGWPGGESLQISTPTTLGGIAVGMGVVTDTVTMRDCLVWFFRGGVVIGKGSEVRIQGMRLIGPGLRNDSSIGVHVTGNNGGVHVTTTDVIAWGIGMLMEDASGAGSNREIFITHATFDSDGIGVLVRDDSYVSIAGCWAASSDQAQIWLAPTAQNTQLVVAGGTIFNGGVYFPGPVPPGQGNGLVVDAGTFSLSGVDIRNNRGVGVWVRNGNSAAYAISGSRVFENQQGMNLNGTSYAVTGCTFQGNKIPSDFGPMTGGAVVTANANQNA